MKLGVFCFAIWGIHLVRKQRCHGSGDVFLFLFGSKDVVVEVAQAYTRNTFPFLLCSRYMFIFPSDTTALPAFGQDSHNGLAHRTWHGFRDEQHRTDGPRPLYECSASHLYTGINSFPPFLSVGRNHSANIRPSTRINSSVPLFSRSSSTALRISGLLPISTPSLFSLVRLRPR